MQETEQLLRGQSVRWKTLEKASRVKRTLGILIISAWITLPERDLSGAQVSFIAVRKAAHVSAIRLMKRLFRGSEANTPLELSSMTRCQSLTEFIRSFHIAQSRCV